MSEPTRTSAGAIASLVLGITGLLFFGLLAGIPAVVCGHVSLGNIRKDSLLSGRSMAIAGLITGYIAIAWSLIVIAGLLVLMGRMLTAEPFIHTLF